LGTLAGRCYLSPRPSRVVFVGQSALGCRADFESVGPVPLPGLSRRIHDAYRGVMQADDPTPEPRISLTDALDWLWDHYEREAEAERRAEMFAFANEGIFDDLAMELHAECIVRGINWPDLLTTAALRCLRPGLMN
jgi:hypothetical protein